MSAHNKPSAADVCTQVQCSRCLHTTSPVQQMSARKAVIGFLQTLSNPVHDLSDICYMVVFSSLSPSQRPTLFNAARKIINPVWNIFTHRNAQKTDETCNSYVTCCFFCELFDDAARSWTYIAYTGGVTDAL
jgi:hypothetical protein